MKKILLLLLTITTLPLFAQSEKFTVSVSTDSILMDNYFEVSFKLENAQGSDFQAPKFEEFDVLSGPNMSSAFSMMNGTTTQSMTYTYLLRPRDIGNYFIQPATVKIGEKFLETPPVEILVVPNPDGIIQQQKREESMPSFGGFDLFDGSDFFNRDRREEARPAAPQKKKKRKTYKL